MFGYFSADILYFLQQSLLFTPLENTKFVSAKPMKSSEQIILQKFQEIDLETYLAM